MKASKFFDPSNLRGDIYGGLTAGVVALPLALAFGAASGVGPIAGLWGAILVGFFAALFGGTPTNVSGPTGPMVVVFAGVVSSFSGHPELIFATVVLAGLIQVAMGAVRLGRYIRLVPYPVISGFMSGIGIIIIALQASRLFGHAPSETGTIAALAAIPQAASDPVWAALAVGGLCLAIVFLWPARWGRIVPGPLVALVAGTLASLWLNSVMAVPAPVLGDIPTGFPDFQMPAITADSAVIIGKAAVILALLGAIDSLLTSLVADNMTRSRHDANRELMGQGIGNAIAGLFGGVPGAGATMRTVVNIRTGGRTRLSGMIHALVLLAVVISLAPLAEAIPHAVLAGILIKVGVDIVDWSYLKVAHRGPRWDLALMALVLGLTVFVDLITAVGVGVVLAAIAFVKQIADTQIERFATIKDRVSDPEERALLDEAGGRVVMFDFGGPLSFGAAADMGHQVRERTDNGTAYLVLDFSRLPTIDLSATRAVEDIIQDGRRSGKRVLITGMNDEVRATLSNLKADRDLGPGAHYPSRVEALRDIVADLKGRADGAGGSDRAVAPA
ncbi:SulP family sulfate permease [Rhodothalassium salexigens DSM 2132]|uniref:SulP family sulfate permease n=1 Tax=Rhodothalassium salexigens DSM 2132 TaxID=1188247 RepID=A0A4R2P758_RHOSA|nr:SulP family inorganic anion transporter [Rhodothalassium salexigens]MBB4212643.1 SulP family sulfate permease [Rhodothalassium salexigens DSM 2132]MBK1638743.1 sodium-independent anion transporter [Rhodothalassium salexigens DSM 2132]TCP30759.1 SulP family sulfate permease [Rhodothalassium salexigens DSM 2132]